MFGQKSEALRFINSFAAGVHLKFSVDFLDVGRHGMR